MVLRMLFALKFNQVLSKINEEDFDQKIAVQLLRKTHIDSNSKYVRNHPDYAEIANGFRVACPDLLLLDFPTLDKIYTRLLFIIVDKILNGRTFDGRAIDRQHVMDCRYEPSKIESVHPSLDELPGNNPLEKKAIFGGFSLTEISLFSRQKAKT